MSYTEAAVRAHQRFLQASVLITPWLRESGSELQLHGVVSLQPGHMRLVAYERISSVQYYADFDVNATGLSPDSAITATQVIGSVWRQLLFRVRQDESAENAPNVASPARLLIKVPSNLNQNVSGNTVAVSSMATFGGLLAPDRNRNMKFSGTASIIGWLMINKTDVRYYLNLTATQRVIGIDVNLQSRETQKVSLGVGSFLGDEIMSFIGINRLNAIGPEGDGDDYCACTYEARHAPLIGSEE